MRRVPGTASIKMSCRLPSRSGDIRLIPVILPPGRASEAANPAATMSSVMTTIGIVRVAFWSARGMTSPPAMIASGVALISAGTRSSIWLLPALETSWNNREILAFDEAVDA